ncbi:MAG: nucleoside-diphosphate kinase [Bacillota bacterium]|nr:nucleoside-diphosphate kinase [Bacillota bacterium]
MEQTFIIIKPEAVQRGLVGTVLTRFENRGLAIKRLEVRQIGRDLARVHYAHLRGKPFFEGVLDSITAGPVVLGVLEGENAIELVRQLLGATDPMKAAPGTIRGDYGTVLPYNVVHASDSPESAAREIGLFFPEG